MEKSTKKCKNIGCTKNIVVPHARKCSLPSKVLSPMKKEKNAGDIIIK